MSELKPCPFCGGEANTRTFNPDRETRSTVTECIKCRAGIIMHELLFEGGYFTKALSTETEKKWNTRVTEVRE